jgi:uncharacterized protein YndB with AHSA1/START domain
MPTARRSRTIAAPVEDLWALIGDPHHLPRWWPRVTRVEDVTFTGTGESDAFTEVMRTRKGKLVRADFDVTARDEDAHSLTWSQRVEGTPFAQVLSSAETQLWLAAGTASAAAAKTGLEQERSTSTEVTIELRQSMVRYSNRSRGMFLGLAPRLGGTMVRRAALATLDEALDGLERVSG